MNIEMGTADSRTVEIKLTDEATGGAKSTSGMTWQAWAGKRSQEVELPVTTEGSSVFVEIAPDSLGAGVWSVQVRGVEGDDVQTFRFTVVQFQSLGAVA